MRNFVTAAVFLAACNSAAARDLPHELSGVWVNEAGSAVDIYVAEDGSLSGHYRTELGQPDAQDRFTLTGWAQGDVVAFSVNFIDYGSITSWSGQLSEDGDGPFIRTLWQHTRDIEDDKEAEDLWRSITAGAATFRRTPDADSPDP